MIINIRGTNGSGKTTLARSLLDESTIRQVDIGGYACTTDRAGRVLLVGPYDGLKTGGCDRLPNFATMREVIAAAALLYEHVVFESVLVSGVYKSWADFDDSLGRGVVWAYLHTPVEECIKRVYARNGGKAFREQNVIDKYDGTFVTRRKAMEDNRNVVDLPADPADATRHLQELLA